MTNYSAIAVSLPPNGPGSGVTVGAPELAGGVVKGALNATDPDGDTLSYNVTGDPATGGAIVSPDGTFTYTPSGTSHAGRQIRSPSPSPTGTVAALPSS